MTRNPNKRTTFKGKKTTFKGHLNTQQTQDVVHIIEYFRSLIILFFKIPKGYKCFKNVLCLSREKITAKPRACTTFLQTLFNKYLCCHTVDKNNSNFCKILSTNKWEI